MKPKQPNFIPMPFCENGNKNAISAEGKEGSGAATFSLGFPQITETPLSIGGLPPSRKDFNGIFNILSMFAFFGQSGGIFAWDSGLNYVPPAMVWLDNMLWFCIKENGKDTANGVRNPKAEAQYWKSLPDYLSVYQKEKVDNLIKNTVNEAISEISSAYSVSFLIPKGQSVSFISKYNATKISVIADTNFAIARDGGQNGQNVLSIGNFGDLTMSASVVKGGSKGHYWGYSLTKSSAIDLNANIKKGQSITVSTQNSGTLDVESTSVLIILS